MNKIDFQLRRELNIQDGKTRKKRQLIIGGLSQAARGKPWGCYCSIPGITSSRTIIYGEDELNALINCLIFCTVTLKEYNSGGKRAWWLDPKDLGGLLDKGVTL